MVSNQLEIERKRRGIGYMLPYLRSVSVCLVLFFLFIQPISWVHAVESATKTAKFPDGWQLVNPPRVVHQRDALGDYLTVEINSKSINPVLPADTHPIAQLLNQYEEITILPNKTKVLWQNTVTINDANRTTNIVEELCPTFPSGSRESLRSDIGFIQRFQNSLKNIGNFLLFVPVALICLPAITLTFEGIVLNPAKQNREKLKEAEQQWQLYPLLERSRAFYQSLVPLQQQFNPSFQYDEVNPSLVPLSHYNRLPRRSDYRVNLSNKAFTYTGEATTKITFGFKAPLPTAQTIKALYLQSALGNSFLKREVNMTGIERKIAVPSKKYGITAYGQYVKQCNLTYTHQYTQSQLSCSTIVYNPVTEDDNIQ